MPRADKYTAPHFAFADQTAVYAMGLDEAGLEADIASECSKAQVSREEMEENGARTLPATAAALALIEAGRVELGRSPGRAGAHLEIHHCTLISSDEYEST